MIIIPRGYNTDVIGKSFTDDIVEKVWKNAITMDNIKINPDYMRRDKCGDSIIKNDYGKTEKFGWEIDHIKPVSKGGTDNLSNLQPLYWENNRSKGDKLDWKC